MHPLTNTRYEPLGSCQSNSVNANCLPQSRTPRQRVSRSNRKAHILRANKCACGRDEGRECAHHQVIHGHVRCLKNPDVSSLSFTHVFVFVWRFVFISEPPRFNRIAWPCFPHHGFCPRKSFLKGKAGKRGRLVTEAASAVVSEGPAAGHGLWPSLLLFSSPIREASETARPARLRLKICLKF